MFILIFIILLDGSVLGASEKTFLDNIYSLFGISTEKLQNSSQNTYSNPIAANVAEEDIKNEISLKSRKFIPKRGMNETLKAKIKSRAPERTHILIQFNKIPSREEQKELEREGIRLLSYIPHKAWFASVTSDNEKLLKFHNIRAITEILTDDKISPAVKNKNYIRNTNGMVNLSVMFFNDVDLNDASSIIEKYGNVVNKFYSANSIKIAAKESFILNIAKEEAVQWIDVTDKILKMHNDGSRQNIGVDILQALPYNLSGINIVTSQWDGGWADTTHDDLQGRVTIGDSGCTETYCSTDDHATHVAGTMLGDGSITWTYRGMAPRATLIGYEWWDDSTELNNEYNAAINTYDVSLSQNSWGYTYFSCGTDCFGGYDSSAAELDGIVRGSKGKKISQMWAAGNERPSGCDDTNYDCIGLPSTAKNVITVGATNSDDDSMTSFSSWGPTNDGRLKPDVTAPGCEAGGEGYIHSTLPGDTYGGSGWCGTSMATPAVSGIIALMLQEFAKKSIYPLPSTIKAILIHTAKDLGNTGPDYAYGYGRINATAAIDVIKNDTSTNNVIVENIISDQGKANLYEVTVLGGQSQLKITLVWDDYPATANANPALVNNLDLVLTAPNGTKYYPWVLNPSSPGNAATKGINTIDNVAQVVVNPLAGVWQIEVKGSSVPYAPQNYSLVSTNNITYVKFGVLQPYLINPTSKINVTQNKFFNFSSGVRCVGGRCGDVNATLDPITTVFEDDFSTDKGWTGYGGLAEWERLPASASSPQCSGGKDPASDHSPTTDNYVVGNDVGGCYNNNIGATYWLTSPVIDCSFCSEVNFSFWRYAGFETSSYDHAYIAVYDGTSWINIFSNGASWSDSSWVYQSYDVSQYAENNPNFRIRFGLGSTDSSVTYMGWNIDDVQIKATIGKGKIPMNNGTPFYTIDQNPTTCYDMKEGDSCNQTWRVNATGNLNSSYDFFTIYTPINYSAYIAEAETPKVNITIIPAPSNRPPTAIAIGPSIGIATVPLQFDASQSYDPDNNNLTYYWLFGDDNNATTTKPIHTYSTQGIYIVNLTVTDTYNSSDYDNLTIDILPADTPQGKGITLTVNVTS